MQTFQNYILGQWVSGEGVETEQFHAITGAKIGEVSSAGIDFSEVLNYGRTVGGHPLRKMTFQERGNMLKTLALYLTKRKDAFYELSYRTGATKVDSWIDIEGGFGNLVILEDPKHDRYTWEGGYLGFPQYKVAVDIRNGDFLAMDVHQWHSNTPIKPLIEINSKNNKNNKNKSKLEPARLSVVSYLRKNMINL